MSDDSTTAAVVAAGIDVSKAKLDVAIHPGGTHRVFAYTAEGLALLDGFLAEQRVARVGFEASGGYEWRLLVHLRAGRIPSARLQPAQVKAFIRSGLRRAKNDRLDARAIAAFTAQLAHLPALPAAERDDVADYLTYLEQLEDQIALLKTTLETTRLPRLKAQIAADVDRLAARRLAEIAALETRLSANPDCRRTLTLLTSIKGIGLRTALAILVRLPEIGQLSREEAAALAGLAPYDDDSGKRRGLRHIHGGRQRLRKSLFMSAFSASRWNPGLKAFYDGLRARGKSHVCATVATARKLIILANAVVHRGTEWTPLSSTNQTH